MGLGWFKKKEKESELPNDKLEVVKLPEAFDDMEVTPVSVVKQSKTLNQFCSGIIDEIKNMRDGGDMPSGFSSGEINLEQLDPDHFNPAICFTYLKESVFLPSDEKGIDYYAQLCMMSKQENWKKIIDRVIKKQLKLDFSPDFIQQKMYGDGKIERDDDGGEHRYSATVGSQDDLDEMLRMAFKKMKERR